MGQAEFCQGLERLLSQNTQLKSILLVIVGYHSAKIGQGVDPIDRVEFDF